MRPPSKGRFYIMEKFGAFLQSADAVVWGPVMILLLLGTGIYLTVRTGFLPWRNLGRALKYAFSPQARSKSGGGDITPFSSLTTALAATMGTGNIVGVATAMVAGGPGALFWMWISALFGLSSAFAECMLAVKYRTVNSRGEISGGPMYTLKYGFPNKAAGAALGWLFALFTVFASFGMGNMAQSNSISTSAEEIFHTPPRIAGAAAALLTFLVILSGIKTIAKVAQIIVPSISIFYLAAALLVIAGNFTNLPEGLAMIFKMAFSPRAIGGGLAGTITVSMMSAIRFGVSRGVFTNEAGLGSAAISTAAASTDNPVLQGYINMTGVFFDTLIVCTVTGLAIAASGALGTLDPATGTLYTGATLTIQAFKTVLGPPGGWLVCAGIILFAFATIIGWEYQGEKAFEYLFHTPRYNMVYRIIFTIVVYIGATTALDIVWNFSDIANALMAAPNLICLLALSGETAKDIRERNPF